MNRPAPVTVGDYLDGDRAEVDDALAAWVLGDESRAREHVADHDGGGGTTLVARRDGQVVGLVTIRWVSGNPAFASRGIPLVHQLAVREDERGAGIGGLLMDAAEELARARGVREIGITVGLFDRYGPAQRLYVKRGYVPDGRGICVGRVPVKQGDVVEVGHDLLLWLVKPLAEPAAGPGSAG